MASDVCEVSVEAKYPNIQAPDPVCVPVAAPAPAPAPAEPPGSSYPSEPPCSTPSPAKPEPPTIYKGVSFCTQSSDNLSISFSSTSKDNKSYSKARLSVIKALTERGYSLNGDGKTMIKK